jgi:hypothetical protein
VLQQQEPYPQRADASQEHDSLPTCGSRVGIEIIIDTNLKAAWWKEAISRASMTRQYYY